MTPPAPPALTAAEIAVVVNPIPAGPFRDRVLAALAAPPSDAGPQDALAASYQQGWQAGYADARKADAGLVALVREWQDTTRICRAADDCATVEMVRAQGEATCRLLAYPLPARPTETPNG